MRQPLKEKLQNAINRALLPDNEVGALIVGGRRRNRKKKQKNRNNAAARNKKNAKKTEGKSRKHGGCFLGNKDDSGHESDPLIEDEAEEGGDNQDEEGEVEDENVDSNKMPFSFFKKSKKDKKEKKDKKKDKNETKTEMVDTKAEESQPIVPKQEMQEVQPQHFKEGTTLAAMASTVPKKVEQVKDWDRDYDVMDGGSSPPPSKTVVPSNETQTSQSIVQEKSDPEKPVDQEETEVKKLEIKDGPVKSENSPLITNNGEAKESKLQDQQPGMLCCTIL